MPDLAENFDVSACTEHVGGAIRWTYSVKTAAREKEIEDTR